MRTDWEGLSTNSSEPSEPRSSFGATAIAYVIGVIVVYGETEGVFALSPTRDNGVLAFAGFGSSGRDTPASSVDMSQSPEYELLRQDEEYRYLRAPACKRDWLDSLKYVRLGSSDDSSLTIGGEVREWYEGFRNALWGVV